MVFRGNIFPYERQMFLSSLFAVISFIFIPIAVIFVPGTLGFILTSILMFILGLCNAIYQSSMYGVCGFLPFKFIIGASTGNGVAGISMNIVRYIIVLIFGTSDDESNLINGSVVFFAIATILLVLGVIAIPLMFKDPYFLLNVYKSGEISEEVIKEICEEYELDSNEYLMNMENKENDKECCNENKKTNLYYVKELWTNLYETNLSIFAIFFVTFAIYPGLCFNLELL